MDLTMIRATDGHLIPGDEEARENLAKIKAGVVMRCTVHRMRNGPFFRKWWALVRVGFNLWSDCSVMPNYKGQPIEPDFDRFRRDITILCGKYRAVANVRGEVRIEADSLKWGAMTETEFEDLYSRTINVLLAKVLPPGISDEAKLRESADALLRFA